jgi:hypothetical protein
MDNPIGKENKASNKYSEINKQFEDLNLESNDFDDDFGDDDAGDFDANELLNLTDYQNKRKQVGTA